MNKETTKREFEIFVRTKQFDRLRLKNKHDTANDGTAFIALKDLRKFFSDRNCKGNDIIPGMVQENIIRYYKHDFNNYTSYSFEALRPGVVDLNMLKSKGRELDKTTSKMLEYLKKAGLKDNAPSTFYFDAFLKYKDNAARLFFRCCDFAGRVHTPVSNFKKEYRKNITIDKEGTISFDVATMQPLILGKILASIGTNEYTQWINSGHDVYVMLQNKAGLNSRDEAKKKFFEILFSKPNKELAEMFGHADWITWINEIKSVELPQNPHNKEKTYSNLAWLLQNMEVRIMRQVWERLIKNDIPFLSVHDEIIVKISDKDRAYKLFDEVLKANFEYYKLNVSEAITPPPPAILVNDTDTLPVADINTLTYQIIEPQNNYSHDTLIQLIALATRTDDPTACDIIKRMMDAGVITLAENVNRYYLSNSTPF